MMDTIISRVVGVGGNRMRNAVLITGWVTVCALFAQQTGQTERRFPAKAYMTGDRVNVRCGPGTNYRSLTKLNKGDRIVVMGKKGEWFAIKPPKGVVFLVDKRFVNRFDGTGKVLKNGLSVWSGTTAQDARVGYLKKGQKVTIVGDVGRWYKIEPPEGVVVYVFGKYVRFGDKPGGEEEDPVRKALREKEKELERLKKESGEKLQRLQKELERRRKQMEEALKRFEQLKKEYEKAKKAYLDAKNALEKEKRMRERLQAELSRAKEQILGLKETLKKVEEEAKKEVRERRKPAPISRYDAVGWLDDMGPYVSGPEGARFCLRRMMDGEIIAYLKPGRADVRLERFLYRRVGVRGVVKEAAGARVIVVETLDDLTR
ncbi:MAG: hypothetical protein DRP82_05650 [Planctomycetota bacterium]|nr:MAG: hypothetical protein DRP82_05650 [Planctomycetota bacterium]